MSYSIEKINLSFLSIDMESARFYRWLQFHLGNIDFSSARIPQTRGSMWKNAEERSLIFVSNLLVRSWRSSGSREQWRSIVKEIAIKILWRVIEGLFWGGCGYYVSNRVMCISGVGVGGKRFGASARRFRRSDCSCQSPRRMRLEMPGSRFESGQNQNFMIYNII